MTSTISSTKPLYLIAAMGMTFLLAYGCSTTPSTSEARASEAGVVSEEVYQRWNPQNALSEAEGDIRRNTIKVFYHGGIAPFPVGVNPDDYELIEGLSFEDAGAGCVIVDAKLDRQQREFATIYNRRIVEWLKVDKRRNEK